MKKFLGVLFLIVFAVTLPCISADSLAGSGGWKKYTDFEEYNPGPFPADDDKWAVQNRCSDENIADVSIEDYNGSRQAKFTYNRETIGRTCSLLFNDCPERIVGIKADVTIAICADNQDCRARVGWHRGVTLENYYYIWEDIEVRPIKEILLARTLFLDQDDGYSWTEDDYWAQFYSPIDVLGETFTVSGMFDKPGQVTATVEGQGTITHSGKDKIGDPIEHYKGIGMFVTDSGEITSGEFVVYFDNIYIKTKGSCDNKGPKVKIIEPKKNVPLDACWMSVTFNEPMNRWCGTECWDVQGNPSWPIDSDTDYFWTNDSKTFSISRTNCDCDEDFICTSEEDLPANTKIEFVVNPNGNVGPNYFRDSAGNPAKKKKHKIKTVK